MEDRFQAFRDIFIWPSYLEGVHMCYRLARRYANVIIKLLDYLNLDTRSKLALSKTQPTHRNAQLEPFESELLQVINIYKATVKSLLDQSIVYATAARDLKETGNYEAVASAATKRQLKSLLVVDLLAGKKAVKCKSLDDFIVELKKQAKVEWEEVESTCNLYNVKLRPTPPDCRQADVDAILERHEAYRRAVEKESTAVFTY